MLTQSTKVILAFKMCKSTKFLNHIVIRHWFRTYSVFRHSTVNKENTFCANLVPTYRIQEKNYSNLSDESGIHVRSSPPWRVLFLGSDYFAIETLKALNENRNEDKGRVVDHLDVVVPNKKRPKSDICRYAESSGLDVYSWPVDVPCGKYDIGVVVSFGKLIPTRIIQNIPHGIINAHASLLPRWRGAAPIAHAIWNDDKVTGISIMKIQPKQFDIGPVLMQKEVPIPEHVTARQLGETLAPIAGKMVIETLADLTNLEKSQIIQSDNGTTYAPKIPLPMGYVDFVNQTCEEIYKQYRAFSDQIPISAEFLGKTVELQEIVLPYLDDSFKKHIQDSFGKSEEHVTPGCMCRHKRLKLMMIKCKDGWIGCGKLRGKGPDGWRVYLPHDFISNFAKKENKLLAFTKMTQTSE